MSENNDSKTEENQQQQQQPQFQKNWITLNVGGTLFTSTKQTLTINKDTILYKMFADERWQSGLAKDEKGSILIDRFVWKKKKKIFNILLFFMFVFWSHSFMF